MKLSVFLQFSPNEKIPVGTLSDHGRDTVFEYDASFLSRGINPAPFRLPLRSGVQAYDHTGNMETFGLFEDSLPDGCRRTIAFRLCRRTPSRRLSHAG